MNLKQLKKTIQEIIKEHRNNNANINLEYLRQYAQEKNINNNTVRFENPNFDFEWGEATRYKIFNLLGKNFYINKANQGHTVKASEIAHKLSNTDYYIADSPGEYIDEYDNVFDILHTEKKKRFFYALQKNMFERSIAIKLNNDRYELLAGNTRLVGLAGVGIDHEIWIIDLSDFVEASQELIALL